MQQHALCSDLNGLFITIKQNTLHGGHNKQLKKTQSNNKSPCFLDRQRQDIIPKKVASLKLWVKLKLIQLKY